MNLEHDLRRALERTDPPLDFTHRVLAEVQRESTRTRGSGDQLAPPKRRADFGRAGGWLAAAATVAIMAAGGARYYNYQQQVAEAKRIEAEVMLAMQITSEALARVQVVLQDTNR